MPGEHHRQRAEQTGVDPGEQRQRQFRRTAQDHAGQSKNVTAKFNRKIFKLRLDLTCQAK